MALPISTATGLLVTPAASGEHLGADIGRQLCSSPRALLIVGVLLGAFGAVPGLPRFPFLVVAATMAVAGDLVGERLRTDAEQVQAEVDEHERSVDSTRLRRPLRMLIERSPPTLPVLSYGEISNEVDVERRWAW